MKKKKSFNEKEKSFRTYLLHHFNVMKKASSLELYLKNEKTHKNEFWIKKFNDIVYGQDVLDWNVLYDVINQLHDGFFIKLKEQFPQLKRNRIPYYLFNIFWFFYGRNIFHPSSQHQHD